MLGVAVGTFALVIVLSVFNGFEGLVKTFFSAIDPDLRITPVAGKFFDPGIIDTAAIKRNPDVIFYCETIEEMAMLKYENRQYPGAVVKGVSSTYSSVTSIDSMVVDGSFVLENQDFNYTVVGQGVAHFLGIRSLLDKPIIIFAPKKGERISLNFTQALNQMSVLPAGIFSILEEVDSRYIFVPLRFAADLFDVGNKLSAIELKIKSEADMKSAQKSIQKIAGSDFLVKNKYQQHDTLFKTMKSEKWATYFILVFVLLIASFNILGSLTMLIIDKRDDISILRSMGADNTLIKRIFIIEGWLISLAGSIVGLFSGIFICLLQIWFGIIKLPGTGSFVISSYPVEIHVFDLALIFIIVTGIGFIAAWYPVRHISGKYFTDY
jgi:lipoprotein-releasing system permease protein